VAKCGRGVDAGTRGFTRAGSRAPISASGVFPRHARTRDNPDIVAGRNVAPANLPAFVQVENAPAGSVLRRRRVSHTPDLSDSPERVIRPSFVATVGRGKQSNSGQVSPKLRGKILEVRRQVSSSEGKPSVEFRQRSANMRRYAYEWLENP